MWATLKHAPRFTGCCTAVFSSRRILLTNRCRPESPWGLPMTTDIRLHRVTLTEEQRDYRKWPKVDVATLKCEDKLPFLRRRNAMRDYVNGKTLSVIESLYDISTSWLFDLRKRFFAKHPDGRIYGERALVPRARIKPYERRAEIGKQPAGSRAGRSGALGKLFERFPDLKEYIDALFLKRCKLGLVHQSRIPTKAIHKEFLDKCRELGLKNEYPFTT